MAPTTHLPNPDTVLPTSLDGDRQHGRLRTPAAADYMALSPRTLEAFRVRGGGPRYIQIGRAVVYDTRDLDEWMAARKRDSTSDISVSGEDQR